MIRTSKMENTTDLMGQIIYEKPKTVQKFDYKLLSKPELIEYAESRGIDIPTKITKDDIYILIEAKDEVEATKE